MADHELHNAIMNLQVDHEKSTEEYSDRRQAYIYGYRDARHAAAELALTFPKTALDHFIDDVEAAEKQSELQKKYDELIYAVGNKYPGQTRHETALMYIRDAEVFKESAATKGDQP